MRGFGDVLAVTSKLLTAIVLSGLLLAVGGPWRGPDCPPNASTCIPVE